MSAAVGTFYRSFDLPWSTPPEERRRFRRIVGGSLLVVLLMSLIMPWLPVPERDLDVPPPVPPRLAKLVLERATPLPPPPPPVETPEPEPEARPEPTAAETKRVEERPVPGPDLDRTQQARRTRETGDEVVVGTEDDGAVKDGHR